jgi:hypothetical protein
MIRPYPVRATTPGSLTALESSRYELIYLHSSIRPSVFLLATRHSPLATFFHPLSFHIDPHSAPVSPLFLTLSSKTREGEGRANKNPCQMPLSAPANPSLSTASR